MTTRTKITALAVGLLAAAAAAVVGLLVEIVRIQLAWDRDRGAR